MLVAFGAGENCCSIWAHWKDKERNLWKHRLRLVSARPAMCIWATSEKAFYNKERTSVLLVDTQQILVSVLVCNLIRLALGRTSILLLHFFLDGLIHCSVSQGLGATKFTNLIGWNGYWPRSRFSHLDWHRDKPAKTAVLLRSQPEWRFARNATRAGSEEGRLFSRLSRQVMFWSEQVAN